jgi:HAD superfamily 5'-nucleotidase-like hydrolase
MDALGDIRQREWNGLESAAAIPPRNRIYVNRNLRLGGLGAIGFDMDHTLALYDPIPFESLAFEEAKKKLLAEGYPSSIADLAYRPDSMIRGLVVDKRRGNILKMDQHRYVALACHGSQPLADEERKGIYQTRPVRLSTQRFVAIDTPFSLPEIDLFAQMVDLAERDRWRPRDFAKMYVDVRRAMDLSHADGSIKEKIAVDPDRYLLRDPELPETLGRLRGHGYRLFLLTNSGPTYTSLIMERLFRRGGGSRSCWTEAFDWIVVRAGKPTFFRRRGESIQVPLLRVQRRSEQAKAITGGGVADLERRLGCGGDRILYFGDHTYGDIMKSKRVRLWRTAIVLKELEREIEVGAAQSKLRQETEALISRRENLDFVRDYLDRMVSGQVAPRMPSLSGLEARRLSTRLATEIVALEARIDASETAIRRAYNKSWGPLFRTGAELSHFAAQVHDFACIYTSRVSNFLHYPVDKYFLAHPDRMPHEI